MKFAFETVIWGRRIDDLDLVLDVIAAAGYEGVEFAQSPDEIFIRDGSLPAGRRKVACIEELLRLLRADHRKLELVGLAGGTLKRRMEFCGSEFRPPFLYIEEWDDEARQAVTANPPFTLGLHPHWFMKVQRLNQAKDRLAKYRAEFPGGQNLLLLPDTAHLAIVGDDLAKALHELADHLGGIHLKDWNSCYGRYSHRYAQGFVTLGKGVVDLDAVFRELDSIAFKGWVVVEQDLADSTPARAALGCARWLVERGRPLRIDEERMNQVLVREASAPRHPPHSEASMRETAFMRAILPATTRGPASFYEAVVEAFYGLGDLEAVKLYSYFPRNDELYLLGVSGLADYPCKKILKAKTSLCGRVTHDQRIQEFDLTIPEFAREFDDPQFLAGLRRKRMITVPIFNPSNQHHLRYLLNLFPSTASFWGDGEELSDLGILISRLADHVADDICSAAAAATSDECGKAKSKKELLKSLVALIQRQFQCEGVSIFLVDETGTRLELDEPEATTGVVWDSKLEPTQRCYPNGVGLTGAVWATGEMRLLSEASDDPDLKRLSRETGTSPGRDECLFAPLGRLGGEVVGVIRLTNKRAVRGSRASTMFADDDAALLDSIIQAALPHLTLLAFQERQANAVARMAHEFQVPTVAIRGAVDHMRNGLQKKGSSAKEFFGEDYLNDILEWSHLLGRLALNARVFAGGSASLIIQPARIHLLAEVVAPAVNQVGPLLKERNFSREAISFSDFAEIPKLWLDRNQFQQVFFNLLSNAIKYADKGRLKVRIEAGQRGQSFFIWFSNWGPGVDDGTEELIFQAGYRSKEAMKRDVSGQGIGLFVVRKIIEAHGGEIRLANNHQPTKFEIALPTTLWHSPPKQRV